MFLVSSTRRYHSNCILILMMSNLASLTPLNSRRHLSNGNEQGFSVSPRIVEIQLPLKITSREDLLAWSKYVTNLMATKMNFVTTNVKDTSLPGIRHDQRASFTDNSDSRLREIIKKSPDFHYPSRNTLEETQNSNDMVIAYPLPIGGMSFMKSKPQDPFTLSTTKIHAPVNHQAYLEPDTNFNMKNPIQQRQNNVVDNPETPTPQPPSNKYLPSPLKTTDTPEYQNEDAIKLSPNAIDDSNISDFKEPAKLANTKKTLIRRVKAFNDKFQELSPIAINNGLAERNLSHDSEPLLSFPFQAVITITKPDASTAMTTMSKIVKQPKTHLTAPIKNSPETFSRLEKNRTLANGSGQLGEKKEKSNSQKKKPREDNTKQQISTKRQSNLLGDLLRMLGVLRKLPKNSTEINVAAPVLSILKGTNSKVQVAFDDETTNNRERRNETSPQAEELNEEDEEEEEEMGGFIQNLLELLPLAAPVLEEISNPNSDVNIPELLAGAIPLAQGFSDPNEEGGVDIPAVIVPILQRLFEGPNGTASDAGALLGPGIQLVAPLIGPIVGPLIGPLSRTFSGPDGASAFASVISAGLTPFSKPGYNGQSILSTLIASTTASLSKEFSGLARESDIKPIVSALVSGLLAGTSAGSSSLFKGQKPTYGYKGTVYGQTGTSYGQQDTTYHPSEKDTYYAPSSYYGYGPPSYYGDHIFTAAIKQILGAMLKLSATSSSSGANLSGASSSSSTQLSASSSEGSKEPQHGYGPPPPIYGLHPSYATQSVKPVYPPHRPTNPPYTNSHYTKLGLGR